MEEEVDIEVMEYYVKTSRPTNVLVKFDPSSWDRYVSSPLVCGYQRSKLCTVGGGLTFRTSLYCFSDVDAYAQSNIGSLAE